MNGALEGLHRIGWGETPVLALETDGADSLAACVKAGKWVELDDITRWGSNGLPFLLSLSSTDKCTLLFSTVLPSVWVQNV